MQTQQDLQKTIDDLTKQLDDQKKLLAYILEVVDNIGYVDPDDTSISVRTIKHSIRRFLA